MSGIALFDEGIVRSRAVGLMGAQIAVGEKLPPEQADRIVRYVLEYVGLVPEAPDHMDPQRRALLAPLVRPPEL